MELGKLSQDAVIAIGTMPAFFSCYFRSLIPSLGTVLLLFISRVDPWPHRGYEFQLQIEAVKQSILVKLGLEMPPAIRGPVDQEEIQRAHLHYQELLAQLQANRTKLPPSTTLHLLRPEFVHRNESTSGNLQAAIHVHLEFSKTAALHQNLNILQAELTLFNEWLDSPSNGLSNVTWPVCVNLYRLSKREKVTPELLTSQEISRTSPSLSLKGVVEQWVGSSEPKLNLGLEFKSDKAAWLAASITKGTAMPSLMIEAETRKAVRKARQLDEQDCRRNGEKCCMRSVQVPFESIGWSDWVVAPRSYTMKFCMGSCPHNYKPATIHTQIKARVHSLSGVAPAPCCVPAAYESMVLMRYDSEGKVGTQLIEDMIVTRCHCA